MDNKKEILEEADINKGFGVAANYVLTSKSTIPQRLKNLRGIQHKIVNVKPA